MLKIRKRDLTNEEKVQLAQNKINASLSMFHSISKDIEEANSTLEAVIEAEDARIKQIKTNKEKAQAELQANKGLQEQLAKFLK